MKYKWLKDTQVYVKGKKILGEAGKDATSVVGKLDSNVVEFLVDDGRVQEIKSKPAAAPGKSKSKDKK